MPTLRPDTRERLALAELSGLSLAGGPGSARVTDLATGEASEVAPGEGGLYSLPCRAAPRLLLVEWEASGAAVSAEADVVAERYCTAADVARWRPDYEIDASGDEAAAAIARAEQVVESECGRALQPVMRVGFVDRDCPLRTRSMVAGERGYDESLVRVVSARRSDGASVDVRAVGFGPYVDLSAVPFGDACRVSYVTGLPAVPPEARSAVCALAAWYLAPKTAPENTTSQSTDTGVISFVVGGVSGAETSIPEVNACIARHRAPGGRVG